MKIRNYMIGNCKAIIQCLLKFKMKISEIAHRREIYNKRNIEMFLLLFL